MKRNTLRQGDILRIGASSYEIIEFVGMGGTSAAYRAYRLNDGSDDRQLCLLKECNPWNTHCLRAPETNLLYPEDVPENLKRYAWHLQKFQESVTMQKRIRRNVATNSTVDLLTDTANMGAYATTSFEGDIYARIADDTLFSLLKTMETLTREVGRYHQAGYLHLDIKPENIFIMLETREQIILFDFDSVTKKDELGQKPLSSTEYWAAPEQIVPGRRQEICEATDLFAIGRIIFERIMHRPPEPWECRSFSAYSFENAELVHTCGDRERVEKLLTDLFCKTLNPVRKLRYSDAQKMLEALDHIKRLTDPTHWSLASTFPAQAEFCFLGRTVELDTLFQTLRSTHAAWISGIGGIGKSTLAVHYGNLHRGEYDKVIFARYAGSWMNLINDSSQIRFLNWEPANDVPQEILFEQKMNKLELSCQKLKTLFVIDNFEANVPSAEEEKRYRRILALENCDFIYTTRRSASGLSEYAVAEPILLNGFDDENDAIRLFQYYCTDSELQGHKDAIQKIAHFVGGHPLTLELLAKQMREEWLQYPDDLLRRLDAGGLRGSGTTAVAYRKDHEVKEGQTSFRHICALFDLSDLDAEQRRILSLMVLMPAEGSDIKWVRDWFKLCDIGAVNSLIKTGWLFRSGQKLSMHPVIREVILDQEPITNRSFVAFLNRSSESFQNDAFFNTSTGHVFYTQMLIQIDNAIRENPGIVLKSKFGFYKLAGKTAVPLQKAIEFAEKGKELADGDTNEISPEKRENLLENLANSYLLMHRYSDAEALLKQCTRLCQAQATFHNQLTVKLYVLYGKLHLERQEFSKAEAALLAGFARIEDGNPEASLLHRLAAQLYMKIGNYKECETHCLAALEIQKGAGRFLAREYENLGRLFMERGAFDQAEGYYLKALEQDENAFGEESHNVSCDLRTLGTLYRKQGRYTEAAACCRKDLRITVKVYGRDHLFTAYALSGLARYYEAMGQRSKAMQCQKRIHLLKERNAETTAVSQAEDNAAEARKFFHSGNYAEALEHCDQALEFYREHNKVQMVRVLDLKGAIFERQHQFVNALEYYEAACSISKELFGDDIYQYANMWFHSGMIYLHLQNLEEAEKRVSQAVTVMESRHGEALLAYPGYYMGLGMVYSAKEQYDLAQKYYQKALDCSDGSSRGAALQNMGVISRKTGRLAEAESYFSAAIVLYEKDGDQPNLAVSYASMGHTKKAQGEFEDARTWYEKSYQIRKRLLGEDAVDTQRMRKEIQECHKVLGLTDN